MAWWIFRHEPSAGAAEKLVAKGKLEAAIKMYRRVLKANPGDTSTLNRVGDLLSRVDKYGEAIGLYRETAERFVEQGFYVKAIAVYKKIHRLDPSLLDVYQKLAELYTLQGLKNDARVHYEVLVDYHERQGDLNTAIGVCRKLIELQPEDPAPRIRMAELYERKGDSKSVAHEYLEIARLLLERDAFEKATQVLERALAVDPGDPVFLVDAARLLRSSGHEDFARSFLADAEERNVAAGRERLVAEVRERLRALEEPAPAPAASEPAAPAAGTVTLDTHAEDEDVYVLQVDDERAAPAPAGPSAAEDPLGEIEVFIKYGFRDKALDRLGELLRHEPHNLAAHGHLIDLLIKEGSRRAVAEAAEGMASAAAEIGDLAPWHETVKRLEAAGYRVAGAEVGPPLTPTGEDSEEFELLETGGADTGPDLSAIVAQAASGSAVADLADLLPKEDEEPTPVPLAPHAAAPAAGAEPPPETSESVDFVVVDDGEFADLEAEVERELRTGAPADDEAAAAPTVEEIVASFKQGVAENLSPEDFDTHYNLGIAYREMGLVDEAIGEFEIAVKSPDYMIGACSLLGLCHRDKGEIETAVEWYRRGLAETDLLEQEKHALLYELGEAYESAGNLEAARRAFAEISLVDGGYRDVGERLAALG